MTGRGAAPAPRPQPPATKAPVVMGPPLAMGLAGAAAVSAAAPGPGPLLSSAAVLLGAVPSFGTAGRPAARLRLHRSETARHVTHACGAALPGVAGLALVAAP